MQYVLAISDLHTGSTLGLCPPNGAPLDDGGRYAPSLGQSFLWDCYIDMLARVGSIVKRRDRLALVINGDLTEGEHHNSPQIISRLRSTQVWIAATVLAPALELADSLYIIRGTEAHVGAGAELEEMVAYRCDAFQYPDGRRSAPAAFINLDGRLFHFAHHGRVGGRNWTKGNGLTGLHVDAELHAIRSGRPVPDVIVRSHYHTYLRGDFPSPPRVVALPGWQLITSFVERMDPFAIAGIGGVLFAMDDAITQTAFTYAPDPDPVLYEVKQ